MKIYIPVLMGYARHGGVTQFLSSFITATGKSESAHKIFDHMGEILETPAVSTFGGFRALVRKIILIKSILLFSFKLKNYDYVFLNPSLGKISMHREMYFAKNCIKARIPFSIFFHGWDWTFSEFLDSNSELRSGYVKLINSSDNVFVLGLSFKDKLVSWGVNENIIYLEKTMVDDDFIPINPNKPLDSNNIKLLFLSRITKSKGIFQAVDAFNIHLQVNPTSRFTIAGTGEDLEELREYVKKKNVMNISFVGFADEALKRELMSTHDVFILPSYSEGMPISIFEAMSYGLVIITRPVGGIPDYFVEGKMGFLIDSFEPFDFSIALNAIVNDAGLRERISFFNRKYVVENVSSSVISNRLLSRFESHYEK